MSNPCAYFDRWIDSYLSRKLYISKDTLYLTEVKLIICKAFHVRTASISMERKIQLRIPLGINKYCNYKRYVRV